MTQLSSDRGSLTRKLVHRMMAYVDCMFITSRCIDSMLPVNQLNYANHSTITMLPVNQINYATHSIITMLPVNQIVYANHSTISMVSLSMTLTKMRKSRS